LKIVRGNHTAPFQCEMAEVGLCALLSANCSACF